MKKDIREEPLYREAVSLYESLRRPGTGQISDAADIHVSPDGRQAVFAGTLVDKLEGLPPTRICKVDLDSGDVRMMTFGPNSDRMPRYSPDGKLIAFLSDRRASGDYQLWLLDVKSGAARPTPQVDGWVEYLQWSPDGSRVLLGVAGHGADVAGGQGAVTSKQAPVSLPAWMPTVEVKDALHRWRRIWIYEPSTDQVRAVGPADCNTWEATWCGNDALAVVTSPGPGEGLWYSAPLSLIDLEKNGCREIYQSSMQLGCPAASPSGRQVAVIEAICSDRWFVAGDLQIVNTDTGGSRRIDTAGVDVTYVEWRSERRLLVAGHRGWDIVVGLVDAQASTFSEVWSSRDITTGGRYAAVCGIGENGDCALLGEGYRLAPEVAVIQQGKYQRVKSFDLDGGAHLSAVHSVETVSWKAPDGLEMQGWLLRPAGKAPHPVIMSIHGGPVYHWRPLWLGRSASALLAIKRGYAVFYPNPRGSSGRGQAFTHHVLGDMGGADTHDYLSGVDSLLERGLVDSSRLGVMGGSYGGYMTAWLVTQDTRFAAGVALAPATNHVSEHLVSNIPHFVKLFLDDSYTNPGGKYFQRSPIMHAHKAKTPTLSICGALDRCTPPEEALQFHNALLENGVDSVLVTYP
ncbi:MAG TPA: S9 family peptidase, partial [Vicinamibacterales bacterium]|nr:S9 family peptidase [Vicinamibacterales bacterium]